ncbi:MAG: cytochrome c family protein [Hyphomicrobiaceae bacterium]
MDSFEFNKIAGAVLAALLLAFGGRTMLDLSLGGHDAHAKPGYVLPVSTNTAAHGSGAAAPKAFDFAAVKPLLAKASADAGKAAFRKCQTCHTPTKGGKNGTGPNLWGVVGADKGHHAGFNYSGAMKEKAGKWGYEELALFIHNPKGYVPGTKMAFAGVPDNAELADILAYLRTLSDNPVPLPN